MRAGSITLLIKLEKLAWLRVNLRRDAEMKPRTMIAMGGTATSIKAMSAHACTKNKEKKTKI